MRERSRPQWQTEGAQTEPGSMEAEQLEFTEQSAGEESCSERQGPGVGKGSSVSLQLSHDQCVCVRKLPKAGGKKSTEKEQRGQTLKLTQGQE